MGHHGSHHKSYKSSTGDGVSRTRLALIGIVGSIFVFILIIVMLMQLFQSARPGS